MYSGSVEGCSVRCTAPRKPCTIRNPSAPRFSFTQSPRRTNNELLLMANNNHSFLVIAFQKKKKKKRSVASSFRSRCSERRWMSSYSTALIRFVFLNPENKNKINPLLLCCLDLMGERLQQKITASLSLSVSVKCSRWRFSWLIGTTGSWSASLSKCYFIGESHHWKLVLCSGVLMWKGRTLPLNAAR